MATESILNEVRLVRQSVARERNDAMLFTNEQSHIFDETRRIAQQPQTLRDGSADAAGASFNNFGSFTVQVGALRSKNSATR